MDIASPCPMKWADMAGDDRVRFCGRCQLAVYDLTQLDAGDARALVNKTEGRSCVRFWTRRDGTVLTQDCPVGTRAKTRRRRAAIAVAVVSLLVVVAAATAVVQLRLRIGRSWNGLYIYPAVPDSMACPDEILTTTKSPPPTPRHPLPEFRY